jgi:hypothetical protein
MQPIECEIKSIRLELDQLIIDHVLWIDLKVKMLYFLEQFGTYMAKINFELLIFVKHTIRKWTQQLVSHIQTFLN